MSSMLNAAVVLTLLLGFSYANAQSTDDDSVGGSRPSVSKLYKISSAANSKSAAKGVDAKPTSTSPGSVGKSSKSSSQQASSKSSNTKHLDLKYRNIPKVLKVLYDEQSDDEPVTVYTKRGFATLIQFAPGERIERCGGEKYDCLETGDSNGWFITGNAGDRSVVLKPKSSGFNTNLILITNLFTYTLDLRILPDDAISDGNWRISFLHGEQGVTDPAWQEKMLGERMSNPLRYQRNRKYTMQKIEGSDDIIPSEAWDDGRLTYIRISNNREKPSFFKVLPDKSEQSTYIHMEGDVIVIHEVARQWVMRYGSQVIAIYNEAYDPEGIPPVNGTLVPGVARLVKGAT